MEDDDLLTSCLLNCISTTQNAVIQIVFYKMEIQSGIFYFYFMSK